MNSEENKMMLMEKVIQLAMLLRRLSAPRFHRDGPRGQSQERALTQVALRDGITQRELMEKLGIQPSSLSELLGKLERGGLIERRPMEDDRRQVNLYISESGRQYLERANNSDRNLIPFDVLNEQERQQLTDILDKLIGAAENACADQGLNVYPPRPEGAYPPPPPRGERFGRTPPPFPHERGRHPMSPVEAERGSDFAPENRFKPLPPHMRPRDFGADRPPFGGPVRLPNIKNEVNPQRPVKLGELADENSQKI